MTTPLHFNRYRAKSSSSKSVPSSPGAVKVPGAPGAATFTPTDAKKLFSKSFTPTSVMDTPWTPILSSLGLDVDCDSSAVSGGKSTNVLTPGPTFLNPFSVCDDFYGCLAGSESETVAGRGANAARHINPFSKSPPKCMLDIRFLSLLKAVESEDDEKVKSLIATGMSLDTKTTFKFETVLMRASQKGSISIVQELIGANAALDEQDSFGSTALIKAATQEHYEIVNLLLQAGASTDVTLKTGVFAEIDKKNNDKSTSLLRAAQRQQFNTAACLLKLGANIDTRDKQRYSPLMYAASAGHKSFVENSIAVGASLAFADREGNTALMLAIQKAEDEGITVLSAAASTASRMSWEEAVAEAETSSLCSSWSTE